MLEEISSSDGETAALGAVIARGPWERPLKAPARQPRPRRAAAAPGPPPPPRRVRRAGRGGSGRPPWHGGWRGSWVSRSQVSTARAREGGSSRRRGRAPARRPARARARPGRRSPRPSERSRSACQPPARRFPSSRSRRRSTWRRHAAMREELRGSAGSRCPRSTTSSSRRRRSPSAASRAQRLVRLVPRAALRPGQRRDRGRDRGCAARADDPRRRPALSVFEIAAGSLAPGRSGWATGRSARRPPRRDLHGLESRHVRRAAASRR